MTETTELVREGRATETGDGSQKISLARVRLALLLALGACVAAAVGALGPAHHVRTTYSWPPRTLPSGTPGRVWYTPLLLIRHVPEVLSASIPCSPPPALPDAPRPVTVLATTRFPENAGGLAVTDVGNQLIVRIGDQLLDRVALEAARTGGPSCAYRLRLADGLWSIEGGPAGITRRGSIETVKVNGVSRTMPLVDGLFSALDLRSGPRPTIDITTSVHEVRTTTRQTVAWAIAAFCAVAALLLVALERRPRRPWAAVTSLVRGAIAHAEWPDAVVGVALLGWWIISPAFWDDGWVIARQSMFSASGGFSDYYDAFGANLPLDYWLEWVQHWLVQSSKVLLYLRLPALLCLGATWVLCRWVLARVLRSAVGEDPVALWGLAAAFLVGAMAWGMTLRPEPLEALLLTGVLGCTVRFLERSATAPLAAGAIFVPLALTAHPAGVVSIAPLLAVSPKLLRWARSRLLVAATIVVAAAALVTVLAFVGSDLSQRRADAGLTRAYGGSQATWANEINRYALLSDPPFGTPLRRASVALIALAVLSLLLRRRRQPRALLDIASVSLAVALLLLTLTPSKWSWHFGALLGLVAIAVATETARLRQDAARSGSRGWQARPFLAIGAAILAAAWSWSPRWPWNPLDLRTLSWALGFEHRFPLSAFTFLPLVLMLGISVINLVRLSSGRSAPPAWQVPWRVATWTALTLAVPLIVYTSAVLVADTAKTHSWTLARQNVETLGGNPGCGLADDVVVPRLASMHPLSRVRDTRSAPVPEWVPPPPVKRLARFALGPVGAGSMQLPWFKFHTGRLVGLFISGTPGTNGKVELEWGRRRGARIRTLGSKAVSVSFPSEIRSILPWTFVSAVARAAWKPGANVVRAELRGETAPAGDVAVTAPVTYLNTDLAPKLDSTGTSSLVFPSVLTYFPCARLPRLSDGVVQVPGQIVTTSDLASPVRYRTSPFVGLLDLYPLEQLRLADSRSPWKNIVLYRVDRHIPGAKELLPSRTTVTS